MELIDNEETLKRVTFILQIIKVALNSKMYQIKKINAYEINEETDLTLLVNLKREQLKEKTNKIDVYVYQFLDFASKRFSAVEKQYIYLHYFLGLGTNVIKDGYYDFDYNCTYCYTNAFEIEKKIKTKMTYVFTDDVVAYK